MKRAALLLALVCALPPFPADARGSHSAHSTRSWPARARFAQQHPCPSTGKSKAQCPNFVIDHRRPLCAGGPDAPENMQWEELAESKRKDREELALCRRMRSGQVPRNLDNAGLCRVLSPAQSPLLRKAICEGGA